MVVLGESDLETSGVILQNKKWASIEVTVSDFDANYLRSVLAKDD
jgi:hypothetical protein